MSIRVPTIFFFLAVLALSSFCQETAQTASAPVVSLAAWKYLSAALAVSFGCIGGGLAVGKMGAIAENPSLSGKAIPYVGLAEGICLWGFLVALLILML
jgi:V/A-type H+-transporting ATPase subunit K